MKELSIKYNSWTHRVAVYGGLKNRSSDNICTLVRALLWAPVRLFGNAVMWAILIALGCGAAFTVMLLLFVEPIRGFWALYHGTFSARDNIGAILGYMIWGLFGIGFSVPMVYKWIQERRGRATVVGTAYQAWKDKTCIKIRYE